MGWGFFTRCVPNNFVPDKLFTRRYIMKRVRELSFHYYSYYCSLSREDAGGPSQDDGYSFSEMSVIIYVIPMHSVRIFYICRIQMTTFQQQAFSGNRLNMLFLYSSDRINTLE